MPTTGNPAVDALLAYGPLGIVVVLFVLDKIHSDGAMKRERAIADQALENNGKIADALDRLTAQVTRGRPGR